MASKRIAVVTGSNKGLGFGIVRGLCKQFEGDVYLTARNEELGKKSVEELKKEGLNPKFHQLDITDDASIFRLKSSLQSNYGGFDVLVNNAGIAYKTFTEHTNLTGDSTASFAEQAQVTMKTNFWANLNVCNALFPLLRPHARVVNISSTTAHMSMTKFSEELQHKFRSNDISMDELCELMQLFIESAQAGNHLERGWPSWPYAVSKIGLAVMSFIQQRQLNKDSREDIVVNACCPGYVDTDMTLHKGTKTIDEGADTPVYLAMLPQNVASPKGTFVFDRAIKEL